MEPLGHADPAGAWRAFTGAWNWAAPLTAAVPRPGLPRTPVVRPAAGGYALSGLWHLPTHEPTGPWLTLPLARPGRPPGGDRPDDLPDLFVLPARSLPGSVPDATDGPGDPPRAVLRLAGVQVPAGLATYSAGTPLRAGDAAYLWTAAAALALGAARRMTDVLAGPDPRATTGAPGPVAAAGPAADLAAVLHDERLSLTAALHGVPTARAGLPPDFQERLAERVRGIADVGPHVLAAVYSHTLEQDRDDRREPLVHLMEASSPILQLARYATKLLPPHDGTSPRKAEHGDDRRIPG
ncbi:hypothetical protein [Streptomyces sp. CRN 30]|uniref:hypothetical protein n=1 Tax=Streptomyces sp. CRN 30 TaxID=3075613 RepID=UPI002A80C43E|nr:hypothetical protein [Streptomyces sp. CRN 30]